MIIYPAIDMRQGRCVRLRQGDPNAETVFSDDPVQMARHWVAQGAQWLHLVNLDGAFQSGEESATRESFVQRLETPDSRLRDPLAKNSLPINLRRLQAIRAAVDVPIQFGGGLRTLDDIQLALSLGADRVVLGTVAVKNPNIVRWALEFWGAEKVAVGIDARDGMVATHGWQEISGVDVIDLGHAMRAMGVSRVIYTDISRDGMLTGVNVASTARLGDMTDLSVIASGGVASLEDIKALKAHEHFNIDGVIVGQAIYTGNLDLAQAIAEGQRPLQKESAGVIPYRRDAQGQIEFLLVWNCCADQWLFPVGGVANGTSDLETARQELLTETGLRADRLHTDFRYPLHYVTQIRHYEMAHTVTCFLAEVKPGTIQLDGEDHTESRWLTMDQAWNFFNETTPELLPALEAAERYLRTQ